MKEQNITFNLDNGESAPLQERDSLVGEQVDCDPDLQDVVDLVNVISSNLARHLFVVVFKIFLTIMLLFYFQQIQMKYKYKYKYLLNMFFCI